MLLLYRNKEFKLEFIDKKLKKEKEEKSIVKKSW